MHNEDENVRQQWGTAVRLNGSLTCCDDKEQQTGLELHFQSWDISMSGTPWIPNPYSYFIRKRARRVDGKLRAAQHTTATSSNYFFPFLLRLLLPADSPDKTQPGVINFPSPSFPPRGKTTVLLTGTRDGRRARLWNRTHVRQTERASSSRRGGGKEGGANRGAKLPLGGLGAVPCGAVRCGRWTLVAGIPVDERKESVRRDSTARGCSFERAPWTQHRKPRTAGGTETWKGGSGSLAPLQPRPAVWHRKRTRWIDLHCLTSGAQNHRETCQGSDDVWFACLRKTFQKTFLDFKESPLLLVAHPSGQALDDWWQKGVQQVAV